MPKYSAETRQSQDKSSRYCWRAYRHSRTLSGLIFRLWPSSKIGWIKGLLWWRWVRTKQWSELPSLRWFFWWCFTAYGFFFVCLVYWPSNLLLYLIVGLGVEMKSVILQHPVQWFLQFYLLWFYPIQRPILPSIKISHQIVNSFFKNFLISLLPKWCRAIFWSRLETFRLFPRGE